MLRLRTRATMLSMALLAAPVIGHAQSTAPYLFRQPALNATDICFSFAGDIWLVARSGGEARRLTSSPAADSGCKFSPDGKWVAYTSNDDGNTDVYVIAVSGGMPMRMTWNPASDNVRGWTPDGAVLFASSRYSASNSGNPRLFTQRPGTVAPTPVALPMALDGAFSPDGKRLAYMPFANANAIWKNYRGGRTSPIWIANLADAAIEKVPRENSSDIAPVWIGDVVYFISDRDGAATIYSYDTRSKKVARVVDNNRLDIKWLSGTDDALAYEQFGVIHVLDLKTKRDAAVPITLNSALTGTAERWVNVATMLGAPALSPTGLRAVFEARGEIITIPAKNGDARNLTNSSNAVERNPTWSPDGQSVAFFSDAGGAGYHLDIRPQTGLGEARSIKLGDDDTYYYGPKYSPDGKRIAYSNSRGELWYADVATGKVTKIDTDPAGPGFITGGNSYAWSPDSRWITYHRSITNRLGAAFVYNVANATSTQITDGMSDARNPVFDASGKYLYFLASTDAGPATDFSMTTYDHPITRNVYAIVLRKDLPSPVAPQSDDEPAKGDAAAPKPAKADSAAPAKPANEVRIDFDNIEQRTVPLPIPARDYSSLDAGKTGILVLGEAPIVPVDQQGGPQVVTLQKFDLAERKFEPLVSDVTDYSLSANGEKLLYKQNNRWLIAAIGQPIKPGDSALNTSGVQVHSDPAAEWRQMYREAFRMQRAFFYDPNYHGLDLAATEKFYAPYVDNLGSRADFDYLLQEVFGNLTVGHLFVGSAPPANPNAPRNGLLGADYAAENGRWRFAKVYAGENWNPQLRAPLTQPGVNVRDGEYLLAVNGVPVTAERNVDAALEGTAGRQTVLRVGPTADGANARDVTVVPLASEATLRHLAWIDENRRTVDRLSGGKLAYIYVPNTANEGYTRFNRYFFAQQDKQGAVVDERFNGGGNIADYIVNYLNRKAPFNYTTSRYGWDTPIPAGAIYGPKVMLINEYAGSGGDELPWLFRRAGVGKLVGKRTWGGLVGIGGYPSLLDGGSVTAPRISLWSAEGKYEVENQGVAPDVDVELEPAAWRAGKDTQLEAAVTLLMQELNSKPNMNAAKRPAFPDWATGNNGRMKK